MTDIVGCQATPQHELIRQLMDSRVPKTEREHAAAREIDRLRGLLREARDVIQTAYEEAGGFWYKAEKLFPRIDAALDTNSAANRVVRRQSE